MGGVNEPIESLGELVAMALLMERRAQKRYAADRLAMENVGHTRLAAVLDHLAREEQQHAEELERLARENDLELDLEAAANRCAELTESLAPVATAARPAPDDMTPYGVLARAVGNEERAFHVYCQIAATTSDPEIRAYAEAFAEEELAHAALLRAERRAAYSEERKRLDDQLPDAADVNSLADLLEAALEFEYRLAARYDQADDRMITDLCDELARLRPSVEYDPSLADMTAQVTDAAELFRDELDRMLSFYDRVAQLTDDEIVARRAQSLMAATLARADRGQFT